jgi:hypothetical protein
VCSLISGNDFFTGENKMKNFRGFALGLVLGLSVALAGVGFAQNSSQNDAGKKTETCCCMSSGSGDSCPMMKEGAKNQSEKHECCCCCSGDSCNMKDMKNMKHKEKQ